MSYTADVSAVSFTYRLQQNAFCIDHIDTSISSILQISAERCGHNGSALLEEITPTPNNLVAELTEARRNKLSLCQGFVCNEKYYLIQFMPAANPKSAAFGLIVEITKQQKPIETGFMRSASCN